jgi:hypothetical protein
MDYARRCARQRPALAPAVGDITRLYLAARYAPAVDAALLQEFRQRVAGFRAAA